MTGKLMFINTNTHVVVPREAINNLLSYTHSKECLHEDVYRGGAIWTICRSCGRKWADDDDGFEEYATPRAILDMEEALASPPLTAPPVLRWELNETVGYYVLKVGRKIIGHVQPLVEGFWVSSPCEIGLCTHNSEHEARRAAEKALGLDECPEV